MADEARAMLDALMGADRNVPVEGASGADSQSGGGGPTRRQKRSCYDPDICPLYCAWSLSSQENPTWAESVAANEGAGGIDIFDLFTNTKSDIGTNPYRVDEHAREEFAALPEHEKRRLGYEDMLARKLQDLVRQCDRTVARNKEKLRREVAQAMKQRTAGSGRGNREDLIVTGKLIFLLVEVWPSSYSSYLQCNLYFRRDSHPFLLSLFHSERGDVGKVRVECSESIIDRGGDGEFGGED